MSLTSGLGSGACSDTSRLVIVSVQASLILLAARVHAACLGRGYMFPMWRGNGSSERLASPCRQAMRMPQKNQAAPASDRPFVRFSNTKSSIACHQYKLGQSPEAPCQPQLDIGLLRWQLQSSKLSMSILKAPVRPSWLHLLPHKFSSQPNL